MKLHSLQIKGFRCYEDSGLIPIKNLSVFIGENDAGKSTIRDAIELLLILKSPDSSDFHIHGNDCVPEVTIEGIFTLPQERQATELDQYLIDNQLKLKKVFSAAGGMKCFVYKNCYENDQLNDYRQLKVEDLKILLRLLNIEPQGQKADLIGQIETYLQTNAPPLVAKWKEIQFGNIQSFLPILQTYSSNDYGNPTNLIKKTLDSAYRNHFYDENHILRADFSSLKETITNDLNDRIGSSLLTRIQSYNPDVINIKGDINVNFEQGLQFNGFQIDTGSGYQALEMRGEGTRKKIFLAILEWDKEVSQSISGRPILKIYDEPDANLDFDAQRKLFKVIRSLVKDPEGTTQVVVVTHSLNMVDRAPAGGIVHVIQTDGKSTVDYLKGEEDAEIRNFLGQISNLGGVRNSSIFYEKCFLLVEGESEDNALPILYKTYFERSMGEDGIVLTNLHSNGAWKNFLKLLGKNKKDSTILFLDADTQLPTSNSNLNTRTLQGIGFDADFLANNVFFIGTKEYEDAIPTDIIVATLNSKFPKETGSWSAQEIDTLKSSSTKFSEDLINLVNRESKDDVEYCKKPILARYIADLMKKEDIERIEVLVLLLNKVNSIIE